MSNDTDEPIVPRAMRHAIVFHAVYQYYLFLKDDTRSTEAKGEYVDLMKRIAGETNVGEDRPQFIVRRKRRWFPQRFDVGDRFDQLRDRWWR